MSGKPHRESRKRNTSGHKRGGLVFLTSSKKHTKRNHRDSSPVAGEHRHEKKLVFMLFCNSIDVPEIYYYTNISELREQFIPQISDLYGMLYSINITSPMYISAAHESFLKCNNMLEARASATLKGINALLDYEKINIHSISQISILRVVISLMISLNFLYDENKIHQVAICAGAIIAFNCLHTRLFHEPITLHLMNKHVLR